MVKLKTVKENRKRECKGIWVDYEMGIKFKIARMGNPKFQAKIRQLTAPFLKEIREDTLKVGEMERIQREAVAETVLVGWKGLEDDDGENYKYSAKRCTDMLADEDLISIYEFVLAESGNQANYDLEVAEDSVKN